MRLNCKGDSETMKSQKLRHQLEQLIKQWDNQSHLGIVLQETDWLLGEFGRLRKLLKEDEKEAKPSP